MTLPAGDRTILGRAARWAAILAVIAGLCLLAPVEHARAEATGPEVGMMPRSLIPPQMMIGDWLAMVRTDGRPQPVRLKIHRIEPGKTAGKLIYASPKRCTVDLEYGGPDRGRHVFYIVPFTNCFRYESTDTVALMSAQPLPGAFSDVSQGSPSYRLMPKDRKAGSGAAPAPKPMVDRMQYVIDIGGRVIETGLMARQ